MQLQLSATGTFSVSLLATDNAHLPAGWYWTVTFSNIPATPAYSFSFFLAFASGATQDISGLASIPNPVPVTTYLPVPTGTPTAGTVPVATGTGEGSAWGSPPGGAPSGPAGGDLGNTYPNPTVTATHLTAPLPVAQGGTGQAVLPVDWLNVTGTPYGAKADIRDLTAIAITSGTNVLTCAGGAFTSADAGKVAYVYGAGAAGAQLVTTISSVTNSTTIVLAANASTTVASGNAFVGTDDTAAWQAALAAVQSNGQTIYLPWGRSYVSGSLSAGVSGTTIRGGGSGSQIRYSGTVVSPCIKATSASTRVVIQDIRISQVDAVSAGTTIDASNFASASIERVVIDNGGGSGAPSAIGIDHNSTNCHYNAIRDCRIVYGGVGGMGIAVRGLSHSNTIDNCRMIPGAGADSTSSGIYITNAHSTTLIHPDTESGPGNGVFLDTAAHATTIVNPYLEANRINVQITSGVQTPVILGGTIESGSVANIQDNGSINSLVLYAWPNSGTTVSTAGIVSSVAAADTSVVVGGTGAAPTIRTATLDVVAAQHPPVAAVGLNSQKITSLANGSAPTDAAAFGQFSQLPAPAQMGLVAWSCPSCLAEVTASALSSGIITLIRIPLYGTSITVTNILLYVNTAGSGLTASQCFVGLFSDTGAQIGISADQSGVWTSSGVKTAALVGGPFTGSWPFVYAAILSNGTTGPALASMSVSPLATLNSSGSNMPCCTNGTGATALPGSFAYGSNAAGNNPRMHWVGLS